MVHQVAQQLCLVKAANVAVAALSKAGLLVSAEEQVCLRMMSIGKGVLTVLESRMIPR